MVGFVALGISFQLIEPKLAVVCRSRTVLAAPMSVPKATMNKECHATTYENNIGIARQIVAM